MEIFILQKRISREELKRIAELSFGDMVKGVVDLEKRTVALGGSLHADAEAKLLADGSRQKDLWGFNIYLNKPPAERLEYNSFINIRPRDGNISLDIKDVRTQERVRAVVDQWVE
jgi:hypothetical protein